MAESRVKTMSRSSLINFIKLSPNHSGRRKHAIDTITIHCVAGNMSIEALGNWFANGTKQASSNYGVDSSGKIGLFVEEENRSWCSSSSANDNRAVTIEVSNTSGVPEWKVSEAAYNSLIALCTDICKRNNIRRLLWCNDKGLIGQVDLQNMTVHKWFANKNCPGGYLYTHLGDIADKVNARLKGIVDMNEETKQEVRGIVQEEVAAALQRCNPLFADISDVPIFWQPMLQELLNRDILNGGTPRDVNATDVNLHQDTVKAVVLMKMYVDAKLAELRLRVTGDDDLHG